MPSRQGKNWCFTLNNYDDEDVRKLNELGTRLQESNITGLVYGLEVGESGTPHIQGFISFEKKQTLSGVKRVISSRIHGEIANQPHKAWEYCKKDGDYKEFGRRPKRKGQRTDLEQVQEDIRGGASLEEIQDNYFSTYAKYPKAIREYCSRYAPQRNWVTDVQVLWGETGTGKTRFVHETCQKENCELYTHTGESWFDGYRGQTDVLFDDYNGSEFKLSYLLKLLDRYNYQVPIKGNYVNWAPKRIWITSNKSPEEWYQNCHQEQRAALKRRFTKVTHFARLQ